MLLRDGTVKVLDFGIATIVAAGQKAHTRIGTVEYMAPEQFSGQAEPRSDLYSLGATLYHMLTGEAPPALAMQPPSPPRQLNSDVSAGLETLVCRTLARAPVDRPQVAAEFRQQLQPAVSSPVGQRIDSERCPNCGSGNRVGAKFCQACGKTIVAQARISTGPLKVTMLAPVSLSVDAGHQPIFVWGPGGDKLAVLARSKTKRRENNAGLYILDMSEVSKWQKSRDYSEPSLSSQLLRRQIYVKCRYGLRAGTDYCVVPPAMERSGCSVSGKSQIC